LGVGGKLNDGFGVGTGVSDGIVLDEADGFGLAVSTGSSDALGSGVPRGLRKPAEPPSIPYRTMPTKVATTPMTKSLEMPSLM
jgi:hypothetical protein